MTIKLFLMKKFIYSIIFFIGTTLNTFAQPEHRLSLGVGLFSHEYIEEYALENWTEVDNWYPEPNDHGTFEYPEEKLKSLPIGFNLHYEYSWGRRFTVGLCLGYDYLRMEQTTEVITSIGETEMPDGKIITQWDHFEKQGELHRHILKIMPEISFYYDIKKHVAMYAKLAAGIRFNIEKREIERPHYENTEFKERHFYCQFSPICIEAGGKYWRGFAEFGYGGQGLGQFGVKHTFKGREKNTEE